MEIKRKIEMLAVTRRRYIVRQNEPVEQINCAECSEPMLKVEQAAVLFKIKQRRIFQIVETGVAHFTETESGALMICLTSLADVLDGETQKNQSLKQNFEFD